MQQIRHDGVEIVRMKCSAGSAVHVNTNDVMMLFTPTTFTHRHPAAPASIHQATRQSRHIHIINIRYFSTLQYNHSQVTHQLGFQH